MFKENPKTGESQAMISSKVSSKVAPAGSPPGRSSSKSSPPHRKATGFLVGLSSVHWGLAVTKDHGLGVKPLSL